MSASRPDADPATLFAVVPDRERIALAVSGGSDSMALLHLARLWGGPALHVLTVDHGLRPGSAEEAARVAAFCARHGIAHETLHWRREGTGGNLPDEARTARYSLMANACAAQGTDTLLTGHTMDDQAETVLLRLGRGSGVDGLAAMRPVTDLWSLRIVRPLLGLRRMDLRRMLAGAGIGWSDDPTNEDRRYRRIAARDALEALAPVGIAPDRLAATAEAMADAREVLERCADQLAGMACDVSPLGYVVLRPAALAAVPRETARRLLARLLCAVSGNPYRPRLDALSGLLARIAEHGFAGATLHGCRVDPVAQGVAIQREPGACIADSPLSSVRTVWDGRFVIDASPTMAGHGLRVSATGEDGLRLLKSEGAPLPVAWTAAPRPARLCTPALRRGPDLLAVPLAGWFRTPEASECRVSARSLPGLATVDPDGEAFI